MATTYTDDYSVGDRTVAPALITVTAALAVTGTLSTIVNGANATNGFNFVNAQTAQALTFDFGAVNDANVIIQEFKWYQSNTTAHGTWQFEGSNNNTAYTTIGATFTLGGVATQTVTTPSANVTAYRYYRLRQVSGTTSSSPSIREIEFKLERLTFPVTNLYVSGLETQYSSSTPSDLRVSGLETQYSSQYPSTLYVSSLETQVAVSVKQRDVATRTNIELIRSKVKRTLPITLNQNNIMV